MHFLKLAALIIIALVNILPAHAGPYTDTLSRCLVDSTSTRDRAIFVRWMFAAGSAHPAVTDISAVSEEALEIANQQMAELSMDLLTELCRAETMDAIKYEGTLAIEQAFGTLGNVAGRELFGNPAVESAMAGYENHLDAEKLGALVESTGK